MDAKKLDVLQGTLDLMILQTLHALGPLHGFGIARRLEQVSRDVLQLNEGTVYTPLLRLQQQGWITARWGTSENNRKASSTPLPRADGRSSRRKRRTGSAFPASFGACCGCNPKASYERTRHIRWRAYTARLRGLVRGPSYEQFDDEIRQHLRLLADRFVAQGMSREEAALAARRQFGNPITLHEDRRALQTLPSIESLWQDVRYALRTLRRNPGFSILAVVVLSLGIGANTAVFSVVDAVLFKPLAFADPDRIVSFTSAWPTKGTRAPAVSLPDVMDWRAGSSAFATLTLYRRSRRAVIIGDAAYFADVVRTSPEFFTLFGVKPLMGHFFDPDEDAGARSVVIGHDFWRTRLAQDPDVLNKTVQIDNRAMNVIAVLPPGFTYPDDTALWHLTDAVKKEYQEPRATISWSVLARLKDGVSLEQAQAQ